MTIAIDEVTQSALFKFHPCSEVRVSDQESWQCKSAKRPIDLLALLFPNEEKERKIEWSDHTPYTKLAGDVFRAEWIIYEDDCVTLSIFGDYKSSHQPPHPTFGPSPVWEFRNYKSSSSFVLKLENGRIVASRTSARIKSFGWSFVVKTPTEIDDPVVNNYIVNDQDFDPRWIEEWNRNDPLR